MVEVNSGPVKGFDAKEMRKERVKKEMEKEAAKETTKKFHGIDLKPTKFKVEPGTKRRIYTPDKDKHYIMMWLAGRPVVIYQDGVYMYKNGEVIPPNELIEMGLDPKKPPINKKLEPRPEHKKILEEREKRMNTSFGIRLHSGD